MNRYRGSSLGTIIGMETGAAPLAVTLKRITGVDITNVPIIGSMQLDAMTIAYSTNNVTKPILSYDITALKNIGVVEQGIHFFFGVRFEPNGPPIKLHVRYFDGTFSFQVVGFTRRTVENVLRKAVKDVRVPLPPKFDLATFLAAPLSTMRYNSRSKVLHVPVVAGQDIILIPKLFEFTNATVDFSLATGSSQTSSLGASVQATWNLGEYDILFTVRKLPGASVYTAQAQPKFDLPIGRYLSRFGKALLPEGSLRTGFGKSTLSSFFIANPSIRMHYSQQRSVNAGVITRGTAVIGDLVECNVEVLLGTVQNTDVMALGVVLRKAPLPDVAYNITDGKVDLNMLPGSGILNSINLGLVISSQYIPRSGYFKFSSSLIC